MTARPASGKARGVWLEDLTWPEAEERFRAGAVVVIPIGARSKEHGHHLPDHGVSRIAIINTGVSTEPPLRIVQRDILAERKVRVACADIRGLGRAAAGLMRQKLGGHGDEHETSMVLAIEPGAVKMALAKPDYGNMLKAPETVFVQPSTFEGNPASGIDYSLTGVRGDPSLATMAKGRKILAAMADDLVRGIRALFPEAFHSAPKSASGAAPRRRRRPQR